MDKASLQKTLDRIDGKGYKAYKDIRGSYRFVRFELFIDYVQGDPFASPSRMRVRVPQSVAAYPKETYSNSSRRIGLENYLLSAFQSVTRELSAKRGSGKSGLITIDVPAQELLERTAMRVTADFVEASFSIGLPAAGRRVLGRQAATMLCQDLPRIVETALLYKNNQADLITQYTAVSEDATALRNQLDELGLVAFIGNGAVLPRKSGVDQRPLQGNGVVKWQSPPELEVIIELPNAGTVKGTGIPKGVTLIVGGGFHGKSTLLNALEHGIYNHKPQDGRELVVINETAVKIRAEDGRRVAGVDISPFINNLPFGQDTTHFTSDNASGSTSQAANILEAVALNSQLLLIDEDTAATNFMIRDQRMQALVAKEKEPITPFIDRVRSLYEDAGVSTILVIGGSGDYFVVADHVIGMDSYHPADRTADAQRIAEAFSSQRLREKGRPFTQLNPRIPLPRSINPRKGKRDTNIKTRDVETISFGVQTIDLSAVSQLVDSSQTRAIADAIWYAQQNYMDGKRPLSEIVELVMRDIENRGLRVINGRSHTDYAAFRKFELAAAINRLRTLEIKK